MINNVLKITVLMAVSCVCLLVGGCAVVDHTSAQAKLEKINDEVDKRYQLAMQPPTASRVEENEGIWVSKRSLAFREDRLPSIFQNEIGLSFGARSSLKDITGLITRETGIRFGFAPDVVKESGSPLLIAGFNSTSALRELLDNITAQADMSWRYNEGSVDIYRFDTKVFQVAALPGDTILTSSVSNRNSAGAGTTTTASGQDSKYTAKLDFWTGLKNDIKGLVQNSAYSVSEANATVTVTGTPQVLAGVANYIKNLNALRMRQIVLEVHVYKVDIDNGRDFGASLSSVFSNIKNSLGVTLSTPATLSTGLGVLTSALGADSTSAWAGSRAVITALSTVGTTTIAAESTQMVLSGESAAINSLREVTYLAEVTSTQNANAAPSIALKPGTITEGFAMTLTPTINGGDYVLIGGSIDISTIDKLEVQSSGGQSITTPNRTTGSQLVRIAMKSGETYMYALRQNSSGAMDSGVLGTSVLATPLGGQHNSKSSNKTLVITMTPYIVNPKTH